MAPLLANLPVYLSAARRMPPTELMARALLRAGLGPRGLLKRVALLADKERFSPDRALRLFAQLDRAGRDCLGLPAIDFQGTRVVEVGCGPLGGFGPIAVARGAASYEGYDPEWDAGAFAHPSVVEGYLRPLHAQAGGGRSDGAFLERCRYSAGGIETRNSGEPVDLVLSVSCLEHINAIDDALAALARASTHRTRQLHLVNFSNHRSKKRPFSTIYEMPREDYHARYGRHINLLRPSDLEAACRKAGFDVRMEPASVMPETLEGLEIHPSWRAAYDVEELAVRTAVVSLMLARR